MEHTERVQVAGLGEIDVTFEAIPGGATGQSHVFVKSATYVSTGRDVQDDVLARVREQFGG